MEGARLGPGCFDNEGLVNWRRAGIMQDYVEQRGCGYYIAGTRIALDSIVLAFKDGELQMKWAIPRSPHSPRPAVA